MYVLYLISNIYSKISSNWIYLFYRLSSCIVGLYIVVQSASPVIFQGDWIIFNHQSPRPFSFHLAGDNACSVHFCMYL